MPTVSRDDPDAVLVDAAPSARANAAYNARVARETEARRDRAAQEAYDRGRRDERARRKSHPIFWGVVLLLAIVGGLYLALTAINGGSLSRGGQVMEANVQAAQQRAAPVVNQAADRAQQQVSEAGHDIVNRVTGRPAQPAQPAPPAQPAAPAR
jgi:hypothetical protein